MVHAGYNPQNNYATIESLGVDFELQGALRYTGAVGAIDLGPRSDPPPPPPAPTDPPRTAGIVEHDGHAYLDAPAASS